MKTYKSKHRYIMGDTNSSLIPGENKAAFCRELNLIFLNKNGKKS